MTRLRVLTATLALFTCLTKGTLAQPMGSLDAELSALDAQIEEVEETIAEHDGGLVRALAETRREALILLHTVITSRQQAEAGGAVIEIIVPAVVPDRERAQQLLGEMAAQQQRIEDAEHEATSAGGLIQAVALSRVETEKLTLAQLQMAYLQAQYGIAFPVPPDVVNLSSGAGSEDGLGLADEGVDIDDAAGSLAWADPDYPDIDYSLRPFELAHVEGRRISGWWTIEEERAAIDDSPIAIVINYSAYEPGSFSGLTALIAQCREGVTSIVFLQDNYLLSDFRRGTFDITYRIDDEPAKSTRWSELTSSKGAGQFGTEAKDFLRDLYEAERFFIRLTEKNGQRHDALFDLSGIQEPLDTVAAACGWSTLELSLDEYRAIQTMLNVGGFNAGTPDGIWGSGSRDAMRAFQEETGLPITGSPNRATLEALGVRPYDR